MDAGTLEQVLYHIHNWFVRETVPVSGCEIRDGSLPASVSERLGAAKWFAVSGSLANEGLHANPPTDLTDETFSGTIAALAIPKALLDVVEEICEYVEDTKEADRRARRAEYQSESFDGYSYTRKGDSRSGSGSGGLTGWQAAFAGDLSPWRKIS